MYFGMILPFFKFITKYLDILKIFFNKYIYTTNEEVLESVQHRYVKLQQMS
jgi:hypothetical protein